MSNRVSILGILHDPGASAMLAPVLKVLANNPNVSLRVFASPFAASKLRAEGIPFEPVPMDTSEKTVITWFEKLHPNTLLTGTSWGSTLEQQARNLAKRSEIRSVTVVDYWSGYTERWTDCDHLISELKDEICVVDEAMKLEMQMAGFPAAQLFVVGHPNLERLASESKPHPGPITTNKVLFLSEPVRDAASSKIVPPLQSKIAEFIQRLATRENSNSQIDIKLHPKEKELPTNWNTEIFSRIKTKPPDPALALPAGFASYDLVLGYQTMGLLEAAYSGSYAIAIPFVTLSKALSDAFQSAGICVLDHRESPELWESRVLSHFDPSLSKTHNQRYSGSIERLLSKVIS